MDREILPKWKRNKLEYNKRYYLLNKFRINRKNKETKKVRRDNNRKKVQELKSNPCSDCKKTYPYYVMQFDHRVPHSKRGLVGKMVTAGCNWETISSEIKKCDLVCANCHAIRTYSRWRSRMPK